MLTRRHVLTTLAMAPAMYSLPLFATVIKPVLALNAKRSANDNANREINRHVSLTLGSSLRHQSWTYAAQEYTEVKDTLVVDENERVRLTLFNDTTQIESIQFNGPHFEIAKGSNDKSRSTAIDLQPGESLSVDVIANDLSSAYLQCPRVNLVREIVVRPCFQIHPAVAV